jgi:hypothetical protein
MANRDPLTMQHRVRRMVRQRRWARLGKVAGITVLVVVVGGAAAFGIDRGVVYGRHLWARLHRPAPPTPTTTTLYSAPTTTLAGTRCADAQLTGALYTWAIQAGTLYEVVALTNRSTTPCVLAGYAALTAIDTTGAALPSPNHEQSALGTGVDPSPTGVLIGPGQQGWFELSYPVSCTTVLVPGPSEAVAPGDCFEAATLKVTVPLGSVGIVVNQPVKFTYGIQGFAVGSFAAGPPPHRPVVPSA